MTRINVVDPETLRNEHLLAEYRELPRIFGNVKAAIQRGETPETGVFPLKYTLGPGHVRFFYPRLLYLIHRFDRIVDELLRRGYQLSYYSVVPLSYGIPEGWFSNYEPTQEAIHLNIQRINERGAFDPRFPMDECIQIFRDEGI